MNKKYRDQIKMDRFLNRRISVWQGISEAIAITLTFAFFVIAFSVM